ncbi:trypsin-like serine protease [Methylobacterium sp. BTF04]|uniref:S1 family peptidase n=1 Tax=Methylobacterium sp. BTF04 TaxID=2708300 RepID=UPI0013D7BBC8|nr:trypsin-like serine protease [Methylobacterium sp. BTF04]NEU14059.1 trypsin-like serine protease [Methylobacterium sp. BTF04]
MLPTALRKAALAAVIGCLPAPAFAVINGEVSRDPDGLRASVVRIESTQGEICSGTLIARDLVLTAAHCVMHQAGYSVVAVDRNFRQRRILAVAAAMHPDFVPGTTPEDQPGTDLALLKLAEPLGADFQPLDPRGGTINTGDPVDIAGFGVVAENRRNTARTLRQAHLVSIGSLQVANTVTVVTDRRRMAETAGAGACLGDSGGPILSGGPGNYRIVGVVSWSSGAMRQDKRARTACGGFTAVTPTGEHAGWITSRAAEMAQLSVGEAMAGLRGNRSDWMARPGRSR